MNFSIFPSFNFFKKAKITPTKVKETSKLVEPLRNDFSSTKDMFTYARSRCVDALNSTNPYEHTVLVDTKQNKVLAEFVGDAKHCSLDGIEKMQLDKDNTILLHGHPSGTPISAPDVETMLNLPIGQVVAFDKNGKFSLVAKKIDRKNEIAKEFKDYRMEQYDLADGMADNGEFELYNKATDYVLKKHAPLMGLRYVSNYDYAQMK